MTYTIEKAIPFPEGKKRRSTYPFEQMEIGDSFLVPLDRDKSPSGIYAAVSNAKKRHNINLTSARVEGGIRVWRIAPLSPSVREDDAESQSEKHRNTTARSRTSSILHCPETPTVDK